MLSSMFSVKPPISIDKLEINALLAAASEIRTLTNEADIKDDSNVSCSQRGLVKGKERGDQINPWLKRKLVILCYLIDTKGLIWKLKVNREKQMNRSHWVNSPLERGALSPVCPPARDGWDLEETGLKLGPEEGDLKGRDGGRVGGRRRRREEGAESRGRAGPWKAGSFRHLILPRAEVFRRQKLERSI
jgi:hypothetical protein